MNNGQCVVVGAQFFKVDSINLLLNVVQGLVSCDSMGLSTLVVVLGHFLGQVGVPKMSGLLPEELLGGRDTYGIALET